MAYNIFIPKYIRRTEQRRTREIISNLDWNELFNLNIAQGDYNSEYLYELSQYLFGENGESGHIHLIDSHLIDYTNPHQVTKSQVGLGNVENTSDLDKPVSTAMQLALNLKESIADANLLIKSVSFNENTGVFTFTKQDDSTITIDTLLEKLAINFRYDSETQSLIITLKDGTTQTIPLSDFITEFEFNNSSTIAFDVISHKVTAYIKSGSITDDMLSSALVAQLLSYVQAANAAKVAAETAKTAAETAQVNAEAAKTSAETARDTANTYKEAAIQAKTDAETAATAAGNAQTAAESAQTEAENKALVSEGHAVGTQGGEDVGPDSPYYHNNSKYWAEEAQRAAGGGVTSFNTRSGAVMPQDGDYTPSQVGLGGAINNSADLYSDEETYSVGDVVIHNNKLYECKTVVTTAEAFNPAKWDERTFEELLSRKQDKLNVGGIVKNNALGDVAKAIPGLDYEIGYIGKTIVFNADGTITETFANSLVKLTTFVSDSVITEQYTFEGVSRTKIITFNNDGSITEVVE